MKQNPINGYTADGLFYMAITLGYLMYDLNLILWKKGSIYDPATIIHHVGGIASFLLVIFAQKAIIYGVFVGFTEFTTPFINLRWFLAESGHRNSNIYMINGLFIWLSFLTVRVCWNAYMCLHIFLHWDEFSLFSFGYWYKYVGCFFISVAICLNSYWFYLITKGMVKVLFGGKSKNK